MRREESTRARPRRRTSGGSMDHRMRPKNPPLKWASGQPGPEPPTSPISGAIPRGPSSRPGTSAHGARSIGNHEAPRRGDIHHYQSPTSARKTCAERPPASDGVDRLRRPSAAAGQMRYVSRIGSTVSRQAEGRVSPRPGMRYKNRGISGASLGPPLRESQVCPTRWASTIPIVKKSAG